MKLWIREEESKLKPRESERIYEKDRNFEKPIKLKIKTQKVKRRFSDQEETYCLMHL